MTALAQPPDAGVEADACDVPGRRTILIVESRELLHLAFRSLLTSQPWVGRVLAAKSGSEASWALEHHDPHIALISVTVGEEYGLEICQQLHRRSHRLRVLLLSEDQSLPVRAVRAAGAHGVVWQGFSPDRVVAAIAAVASGGQCFPRRADLTPMGLTPRERAVLEQLSEGATNREIGLRMALSPHTVKEHTIAVYRKLGVRNRTEAVGTAQRLGLVA